jgi:single-strand DNA-binding protein
MANLNKVMLIGNLTRDPEVRYTPKGTAIAEIGLAVNRNYTTESGEKKEEVTFVDVELWGRQAEIAGEYLKKGRPVFIEGRLKLDSWEDKQTGQKKSKLRVVAEGMQFLGSREGGAGGGGGGGDEHGGGSSNSGGGSGGRPAQKFNKPPTQKPAQPSDPELEPEEDDIPF